MKELIVILLVIALIIASPFITVWAINAIFGTSIAMSVKIWFAIVWLHIAASGGKSV